MEPRRLEGARPEALRCLRRGRRLGVPGQSPNSGNGASAPFNALSAAATHPGFRFDNAQLIDWLSGAKARPVWTSGFQRVCSFKHRGKWPPGRADGSPPPLVIPHGEFFPMRCGQGKMWRRRRNTPSLCLDVFPGTPQYRWSESREKREGPDGFERDACWNSSGNIDLVDFRFVPRCGVGARRSLDHRRRGKKPNSIK